MDLFKQALDAKLPFIGVHTDDVIYFEYVLQSIAQKKITEMPHSAVKSSLVSLTPNLLYVTTHPDKTVSKETYLALKAVEASCVVINGEKNPYVFDAGELFVPESLLKEWLIKFVEETKVPDLVRSLQGLSFKSAQEIVRLTMARTQECTAQAVRQTRTQLTGRVPGLEQVETNYDFYQSPEELTKWLILNEKYFLDQNTPKKLVPRGLMVVGDPGVGKSMMAKVIARHWNIPLFRINLGGLLNKMLGTSEERFDNLTRQVEMSSPCVLLLDEIEKLFITKGEEGTIGRILSQLLWWLETHPYKIITLMTSNDLSNVPKELYRAGRIDSVFKLEKLSLQEAKHFTIPVYQSILGQPPSIKHRKVMYDALSEKVEHGDVPFFSHAEVVVFVANMIKQRNWVAVEDPVQSN
jgi:DNA replication protein DnaC